MRAMIWIVVVLTVLLAGAVVADGVLRQQTEERIATCLLYTSPSPRD